MAASDLMDSSPSRHQPARSRGGSATMQRPSDRISHNPSTSRAPGNRPARPMSANGSVTQAAAELLAIVATLSVDEASTTGPSLGTKRWPDERVRRVREPRVGFVAAFRRAP